MSAQLGVKTSLTAQSAMSAMEPGVQIGVPVFVGVVAASSSSAPPELSGDQRGSGDTAKQGGEAVDARGFPPAG